MHDIQKKHLTLQHPASPVGQRDAFLDKKERRLPTLYLPTSQIQNLQEDKATETSTVGVLSEHYAKAWCSVS